MNKDKRKKKQIACCHTFRLTENAILERFETEVIVLRLSDLHLIKMNSVAAEILEKTNGRLTEDQIATVLAKKYKTLLSVTKKDIVLFYRQMRTKGIIELVTN